MSNKVFYPLITALFSICIICAYYIAANTVLKESLIPKVRVGHTVVATQRMANPQLQITTAIVDTFGTVLQIQIDGQSIPIYLTNNDIEIRNLKDIQGFGSGVDLMQVLGDGAQILAGRELEVDYQINPTAIAKYLPVSSSNYAYVLDGYLHNCESGKFNLDIDNDLLAQGLTAAFAERRTAVINLNILARNKDQLPLIAACRQALQQKIDTDIGLKSAGLDLHAYLAYKLGNNGELGSWIVSSAQALESQLYQLKQGVDSSPSNGIYEPYQDKVLLLSAYSYGQSLNVSATAQAINEWLKAPQGSAPLIFDQVPPSILNNYTPSQILDFTRSYSAGKSRIDIYRNGSSNPALLYAHHGMLELHNRIVMPGQEFSYIQAINPRPSGYTQQGRPIGAGICNATTTLFRAALEGGFPITDRSYHYTSFPSYAWGYPENIVDAAYLTDPVVDFKFVNDLEYPILLRVSIDRSAGDGWQYHTLTIHTNSNAPLRETKLHNFRVWNRSSPTSYEGQFDRTVTQSGSTIRSDSFYSRYF